MRVMVIGGSGFIGQHLCAYLANSGHQIVATARSLEALHGIGGLVEPVQLDLQSEDSVESVMNGIEAVVFLAARAHVIVDETEDPLNEYRKVNVQGALKIARWAASQGVVRFIYISSIGVNGTESKIPFCESDLPNPGEAYAQSKWEAEQALVECCKANGMDLVVLRPPLVYGINAPGNFARLLKIVAKGYWLPLGGLTNKRTLIAIENLVQIIEICLKHPAAANQLFLVADDDDISTSGLLTLIGNAIGKPVKLFWIPGWLLKFCASIFGKRRELNRLCGSLQVNTSKARTELNWQPAVSLEQGLNKLDQNNTAGID
jgi:nucleoside-diphosphate-sugar epimerase